MPTNTALTDEDESFPITKAEYYALMDIRGLNEDANSMVMCADGPNSSGHYILKGSSDALESLASNLAEEIYEELSPKANLKHLARLYGRLSPDSDLF